MDGKLHLFAVLDGLVDIHLNPFDPVETGDFRINLRANSGRNSSGDPFATANQVLEMRIEGGPGSDTITMNVADFSDGAVEVREIPGYSTMVDGGFSDVDTLGSSINGFLLTESNFERHSAAFRGRKIAAPVALGTPTTISGVPTDADAGDTFILEVDWGDGTQQTYTFAPGTFVSGQTVIGVQHTYDHVGKYDVGLTWHDQLGLGNSDDTLTAWVLPAGGAAAHQAHAAATALDRAAPPSSTADEPAGASVAALLAPTDGAGRSLADDDDGDEEAVA
jgi:hypothetical protein